MHSYPEALLNFSFSVSGVVILTCRMISHVLLFLALIHTFHLFMAVSGWDHCDIWGESSLLIKNEVLYAVFPVCLLLFLWESIVFVTLKSDLSSGREVLIYSLASVLLGYSFMINIIPANFSFSSFWEMIKKISSFSSFFC